MSKNHVPNWKLERYLLGGLPAKELKRIAALEQSDSNLRGRIDKLRASNAEILEMYPPEAMLAKIEGQAAGNAGSGGNINTTVQTKHAPAAGESLRQLGQNGIPQWIIPAFTCTAVIATVAVIITTGPTRNDTAGYGYESRDNGGIAADTLLPEPDTLLSTEMTIIDPTPNDAATTPVPPLPNREIRRKTGGTADRLAPENTDTTETEEHIIKIEETDEEREVRIEEAEPQQETVEEHEIGIEETEESLAELPQDTSATQSGRSLGIQAGIGNDGRFVYEAYLRLGLTKRFHGYMGLGKMSGSGENSLSGAIVTVNHDYKSDAFHFAGFLEWHAGSRNFGIYGGPGVVLGYYAFDLNPVYNDEPMPLRITGPGIDFGVQGGTEWRSGAFVIGANVRLTYGRYFWSEKENSAENKGVTNAAAYTFGISAGFAF
ncbi:MAG: hypothetical protein LBC70_01845 [Chitinispirillales bacterium]|jgi:hypothetical protein|nr:hypothetical protein [Chitinispirillales bacterium]